MIKVKTKAIIGTMSRIKISEVDKDVYLLSTASEENFMYASGHELRCLLDDISNLFEEIQEDEKTEERSNMHRTLSDA